MNANKGGVFWQGGNVFELFSGRGNNPVAHWKLCGGPAAIRRVSFLTTAYSLFSTSLFSFGIWHLPFGTTKDSCSSKGPTGHCRRIVCIDFMNEKQTPRLLDRVVWNNSTILKMNQKKWNVALGWHSKSLGFQIIMLHKQKTITQK